MGEYRERTTGEVASQGAWRSRFPNMSLPKVWKQPTLDALNLDAVLPMPPASTTDLQYSERDGVEQDANGNWVEKYVARDMFSEYTDEDGVVHTKAEQETAYQTRLNNREAESVRTERNKLLADTDWWALSDHTMTQAQIDYRQALRDVPAQDGFPTTITWPTKP